MFHQVSVLRSTTPSPQLPAKDVLPLPQAPSSPNPAAATKQVLAESIVPTTSMTGPKDSLPPHGQDSPPQDADSGEAQAPQAQTAAEAIPMGLGSPVIAPPPAQTSASASSSSRPPNPTPSHELPFVQPSSYLRPHRTTTTSQPQSQSRTMPEKVPNTPLDKEQMQALFASCSFVLHWVLGAISAAQHINPASAGHNGLELKLVKKLKMFDNDLLIKKCIGVLVQNGIVSAPLWDSNRNKFAGLLTSNDFLNVIQYYCQFPDKLKEVDQFRLGSMRGMSISLVTSFPSPSIAHSWASARIPLVDTDDETSREWVVCVLTQYRILKFIAVNNESHTSKLRKSVREIGLGTYNHLATARMTNNVLDVVHLMVKYSISAVPIVDKENRVLNVFEAVDVIPCIKGGKYDELSKSVGEALTKRNDDFAGVYSCNPDDRLDSIFDTIRKSRVHRLVVMDDNNKLKGVISLSDILKYLLLTGENEDRFYGGT
ncbi:hypothetical protein MKZ38_006061 [Zalerion maritima]|uniref:CBS domain-containing protein n=1 Tax=Zalerion maritima TaxID=339359 RepID=A0AAD5RJ92_9PEZI|nr:hypothetical protein MKZ38_006061 [Zalerion maritima]